MSVNEEEMMTRGNRTRRFSLMGSCEASLSNTGGDFLAFLFMITLISVFLIF